jgi:hypothetical protein
LSIKIHGTLADDAKLTLSDGNQTHLIELGFVSGKESAGDQAKEIINGFYGEGDGLMGMPPGPATKAAQNNNAIEHYDKDPAGIESFWYASSTKDTLGALIQDNENYLNVGNPDYKKTPVIWDEVDANTSKIKFVYVNAAGNSGPVTLESNNWTNVNPPWGEIRELERGIADSDLAKKSIKTLEIKIGEAAPKEKTDKLKEQLEDLKSKVLSDKELNEVKDKIKVLKKEVLQPGAKLPFGKSLTAFIPSAIGLVLILLVLVADAKPSARKHIMHVAVLIGLLGFVAVSLMIGPAVAEMTWLRGEPNGIIQASSLKPTTMLLSAGLLLIFVILCVVSFIQARKDMAAQAKKDSIGKKKAPQRKLKDEFEDKEDRSPSKESKRKDGKRDSSGKDVSSKGPEKKDGLDKPKRSDGPSDSAKRPSEPTTNGLPVRKPIDSPGKKDSFDPKSKKDSPAPKDTPELKKAGKEKKKESGFSDKESNTQKSGDWDKRKDFAKEPDKDGSSGTVRETEKTADKKEDADSEPRKESEDSKDSSGDRPEEK